MAHVSLCLRAALFGSLPCPPLAPALPSDWRQLARASDRRSRVVCHTYPKALGTHSSNACGPKDHTMKGIWAISSLRVRFWATVHMREIIVPLK